ncbi:MAG: LysR family transcriptional regulator [Bdellovibrionales bacterium]|nr:LysR family transcriptional regulator [Bdellovibrionales bacterium]
MWITLEQLACLRAVSEQGSVSAASEYLRKAKSAVHYSLKKLEEQVGFTLVDTGSYRGQLTPKANQLLLSARPLLDAASELEGKVHQIASGAELKLRISTTALFPIRLLNRHILQIQKNFPQTEISLSREILSGQKMLKTGLVDIAIFEKLREPEGLEYKSIGRVKMLLAISRRHPYANVPKRDQSFDGLMQYPQVIQTSTLQTDDAEGVYKTTRQWRVNELDAKKQIILDGLGWGRLPEHEISGAIKKGQLIILEHLEEPLDLEFVIARRMHQDHGQVSQLLWEMDWK